ncbi:pentatricopeptide repeat-containing protein [Pyrus ussuriensis x Pyrus communis]|uniref:Pentatricopeptide repeat-containing protein n=1 Tax=Pyrus ussuriensis x Pyrus communis TaxID=2448454 RepID=A0A5N5ICI8_9ROSA|nr:pentatricopeptide repeat-containing protein [Pyrus ussuriensis x Pyrus communis]
MLSKLPTNVPPHLSLSLRFLKIYCNSGDLQCARRLFDQIPEPDLRAWTMPISGYTRHGFLKESIYLYDSLRARPVVPDNLLLLSVAKACAALGDMGNAKELHDDDVVSLNASLTAYF